MYRWPLGTDGSRRALNIEVSPGLGKALCSSLSLDTGNEKPPPPNFSGHS